LEKKVKEHSCDICGKVLSRRDAVTRHKRQKHSERNA
jgi:uncharacterized Zn-finger protein